jgi:hypothetical protein
MSPPSSDDRWGRRSICQSCSTESAKLLPVILQCSARISLGLITSENSIQSATYKPLIHPPLCKTSYSSGTNNKDLGKRSHLFTLDTRFTCSAYYTIHPYTPCYSRRSSPHTQSGHRCRENLDASLESPFGACAEFLVNK